jgi:hypothetical protein
MEEVGCQGLKMLVGKLPFYAMHKTILVEHLGDNDQGMENEHPEAKDRPSKDKGCNRAWL